MRFRKPEQPRWALLLNPDCLIICVPESDADNKLASGWIVVARESELLPFNPPRLIPDDEPLPVRRPKAHGSEESSPQADGA